MAVSPANGCIFVYMVVRMSWPCVKGQCCHSMMALLNPGSTYTADQPVQELERSTHDFEWSGT